MKILNKMLNFIENRHRQSSLQQLRAMPERQLVDCGISPELLAKGVAAWPWRAPEEPSLAPLQLYRLPEKSRTAESDPTQRENYSDFSNHQDAA